GSSAAPVAKKLIEKYFSAKQQRVEPSVARETLESGQG
ncbi:MAG: hypothetical protein GTO40_28070, partial [Deltaproteobacteria bacterium]|nr:hypothetical protein [Deltaproteobacteria bacterium]